MKKFYLTLFLMVAMLGFTACDDELEIQPFDIIDESRAYEDIDDLEQGALGVYGSISGVNIIDINARIVDNLRIAEENTGQGIQIFNHDYSSGQGEFSGLWNDAYQVIDRANRLLAAIERIPGETAEEQARVQVLKGEMIAMRAWQHFDLWRNFVDFDDPNAPAVPYMLESVISQPARLDKAEFLTRLTADLNEAESLLPNEFPANNVMTLHALHGLRARVALYSGDYPAAIDYATRVINAVPLTDADNFLSLWDDTQEGEVIFKLERLTPAEGTVQVFERTGNEDVFFNAGFGIIDLFDAANDIRFQAYFDGDLVKKYNWRAEKNLADIKLMRTAEMVLIRAEAYARTGDLTNAAADISLLHDNRLFDSPAVSFASQEQALQAIAIERRKELAFEGHRYYDLKRTGQSIIRDQRDLVRGATSAELSVDNFRFLFPIPQAEVFANENMTQNPGYEN